MGVQAQLVDNVENNIRKETYGSTASKHMYMTITKGTVIQNTSEYVQDCKSGQLKSLSRERE
jgi:hypothetical protein